MDFFSNPALTFVWETVRTWWWLFLPFLLFGTFRFVWMWWRNDAYDNKNAYELFEIHVPQDVERPIKVMENVFAGLWQVYDPPNARERWFEGQYQYGLSIELVSKEGEIHFYLRSQVGSDKIVAAAIYSQYPDAEITRVEDYTKEIPQDIPNKDWEFWGASYKLYKEDFYPIKTYPTFFEPSPGDKEETKVDPMALLIENLTKLEKDEHIWIQFFITPIALRDIDYMTPGRELVDRLASRPEDKKPPSALGDLQAAGHLFATGQELTVGDEEERRNELFAPELRLTPGEREIVQAVETKLSKPMFRTHSRFMYIAKRDAYKSPGKALALGYYNQFQAPHLNSLVPLFTTKVHTVFSWFLDERRRYLKKRRMFHNYTVRLGPFFPRPGGEFLLNIEEMATLFHFPGRISIPSAAVPRVPAKKGEAPSGLPVE